jgi:hypothetical protein
MRIGGEAPRGGPILNRGAKAIVQRRVAAASGGRPPNSDVGLSLAGLDIGFPEVSI